MVVWKIVHQPTGEIKEIHGQKNLVEAIRETGWPATECVSKMFDDSPEPGRKGRENPPEAPQKAKRKAPANKPKGRPKKDKKKAVAEVEDKPIVETPKAPEIVEDPTKVPELVEGPTEAEKEALGHKAQLETLAISAEVTFLKMGQLLYEAQSKGEWSILHYESYREYIEDLRLPMTNSYSWATRLANIFELLVLRGRIDEKTLAEIGVAKLTRLLPLARKGELSKEVVEAAKVLSDLDLREQLGHNVQDKGDSESLIICPRCGNQFSVKTASRVK